MLTDGVSRFSYQKQANWTYHLKVDELEIDSDGSTLKQCFLPGRKPLMVRIQRLPLFLRWQFGHPEQA